MNAYLTWIAERVQTFVDHPVRWAQIEAVATALLENDELSADRVEKIVAKQTDKIMDG